MIPRPLGRLDPRPSWLYPHHRQLETPTTTNNNTNMKTCPSPSPSHHASVIADGLPRLQQAFTTGDLHATPDPVSASASGGPRPVYHKHSGKAGTWTSDDDDDEFSIT